ncbi:adhesion G protein-coupled receptor F5 [Python bivittatus]|uniref:Adhesion G protein-coupled receptor F5 n=1 Tax=Python bivittatus TaxID=176946 RepID=A0A9F2NBW3_PYTBI|nr:adhesion G protein-coupled receptor F5 [Python bivittatus]
MMLFWRIAIFSALMRVYTSSQISWDFSLGSFIYSPIHSKWGKTEDNTTQLELHRQKRQDFSPEYSIAVEINFVDASLQEDLRSFLRNLSLPVSVKIPDSDVSISHINITTVCNSTGTNHSHCFCEPDYGWSAKICEAYPVCHNTTAAVGKSCNCIAQLPPQGTFCQLQSEDIPSVLITKMSVRLNLPFENALWDPSSALFKQYKHDLEKAFTAGYSTLPGFINVTVTGFRPGSTMVDYEITSARQIPLENAHPQIAAALGHHYQLATSTFATEILGKVNISVSPEHIFEGDTVKITCTTESTARTVKWGYTVARHGRLTVTEEIKGKSKVVTLTITDIKLNEADNFSCNFKDNSEKLPSIYRGDINIMVSQIKLVPSENVSIVCNGADRKELSCCTDREIQLFSPYWRPNGAINISGSTTSMNNCTTYLLQASESQCPANKSGSSTYYTCELNTTYGARANKRIRVTYFRMAKITLSSLKHIVSEGDTFFLTCQSDVSNYDKVIWKIQNGRTIKEVASMWYTTTKNSRGATSVLTVPSANQGWTGTYICTFSQSFLSSSGNTTIKVIPLLREQEIIRDPIETIISCPATRILECCTSRMENYTVHFFSYDHNMPLHFMAERRKRYNLNCYYYVQNFTDVHCSSKGHALQVHCMFRNQINHNVTSRAMVLNFIPAKNVTCNSLDIGVGADEAQIIKPCLNFPGTNNSVRGNITYKCDHTEWTVHKNSCLAGPINNILISAESLASSPESQKNLPTFLKKMNETTKEAQEEINNSAANLNAVLETLTLISAIPVEANEENMANFGSTVETIIASPTETWKHVKNGSSQLLASVERFLGSLQPVNQTVPSIIHDSLQIKGTVLGKSNISIYNSSFAFLQSAGLRGNVLIDDAKFDIEKSITIVSVAYSTIDRIIPQYREEIVNSLVMATVINPQINEDFQIKMTFAKHEKAMKNPQCVFWNFSLAEGGDWDNRGCETKDDGDNVICSCNHTTSFAMLMSPHLENSLDELTYITYIGLSLSILSLMACIGIELFVWKSVTKTRIAYMRHVCILNIAVSLLIADICFIVVAAMHDQNYAVDGNLCVVATFFIHFFFLCVFFWMLALGLMLFYHLVFLLHSASKTIMKAIGFCLGYICPLVISAITIASTLPYSSYTKKKLCFLNWEESKALLALVIPAMIIVAINTVVTVVVIAKISRRSIGEKSINEEKSALYRIAKSIGVLTPLLGLTWGFGLATVIPGSPTIFHMLFTIFNAFQGLFILLGGTLWDRKVREAMLNKYSLSRWSSQHSKSMSQGMSAPMLSINSPFSRTLNNLFGKAGKYQVSSTESSTVSSENTSKAYSLLT